MEPIQSAPQSSQQTVSQARGISKPLMVLMIALLMSLSAIVGYFAHDYISTGVDNLTPVPLVVNPQSDPGQDESEKPIAPQTANLPAVIFEPGGAFTEVEKTELYRNVINPMKDYELSILDNPEQFVAIVVEKLQPPSAGLSAGYTYSISSYYQNNRSGGFLYGNASDGSIPIWTPDCMGECKFSKSYQQKYPYVIEEYKKRNQ